MVTTYVMTQSQLNRVREICQAGTQAHGDEFYEQIMETMDGLQRHQSGTLGELLAEDDAARERAASDG